MKATIATCEATLRKRAGLISLAAEDLGMTRQSLHDRIKRSARLQAVLLDIEERALDMAEGTIMEALAAKDRSMAKWYAARKGKRRGFTLKHEVTGADGAALFDPTPMIEGMTDEQLAAYRAFKRTMGAGPGPSGGPPPED